MYVCMYIYIYICTSVNPCFKYMECSVTQFGVSEFCETLTGGVVDTPGGGILRYLDLLFIYIYIYICDVWITTYIYTHIHIRSHLAQAEWHKSSCLTAVQPF